jgi:hypothetical protein
VNLKDRPEPQVTGTVTAFLTAIVLIGIVGLAIMFVGSLVLRNGAGLSQELIGCFMLFTFLLTGLTEVMLIKNLTKLTAQRDRRDYFTPTQQPPLELRPPAASVLGEPVPSVTENTTRTLGYARREH